MNGKEVNKMKKILSLIAIFGLVVLSSAPAIRAADGVNTAASTASVTNVASVASAATIVGGETLNMTEAITTDITVTATVTDNNGCEDISTVAVTLYNTASGEAGTNDPEDSYTSTMAVVGEGGNTCTGSGDLSADYTKTFAVEYYAIPGEWTALVTPAGVGATTDDDTSTIATLRAINVLAEGEENTIEFGALALGADTGTGDDTTTVTNTGNIVTGVTVNSSSATTSMTCTVSSVPVANEKFDLGTATAYASKTAIGALGSAVDTGVSLAKATSGTPVTDTIQWGFGLPENGVGGNCTGTVIFTGVTD
jgi:hypothetical protein